MVSIFREEFKKTIEPEDLESALLKAAEEMNWEIESEDRIWCEKYLDTHMRLIKKTPFFFNLFTLNKRKFTISYDRKKPSNHFIYAFGRTAGGYDHVLLTIEDLNKYLEIVYKKLGTNKFCVESKRLS